MDQAALAWRRSLEDPCNAPLAYPCYSTGGGGTVLIRCETDALYFTGATETAGIYAFVPGMSQAWINTSLLPTDTFGTLITGVPAPGTNWLNSNAGSVRAVAACVQVMYPGSELNRAGVVGVGTAPAETLVDNIAAINGGGGINVSAAVVRTTCAHVERMPATMVEAKWYPGEADQVSQTPILPSVYTPLLNGRNALVVSVSGFPVSTGVRIRAVAIYEVGLNSVTGGLGTVVQAAPPVSTVLPATVIKSLFDKDPQWWLETAVKTGRTISNVISYAAAGAKAAGRVMNGLAIMAA